MPFSTTSVSSLSVVVYTLALERRVDRQGHVVLANNAQDLSRLLLFTPDIQARRVSNPPSSRGLENDGVGPVPDPKNTCLKVKVASACSKHFEQTVTHCSAVVGCPVFVARLPTSALYRAFTPLLFRLLSLTLRLRHRHPRAYCCNL